MLSKGLSNTKSLNWTMTRRHMLAGAGASLAITLLPRGAGAQDSSFTVMTVGGTWGDAIRRIIVEPFAQMHGLTVVFDNRPNAQQLAVLQASKGNPSIDAIELGGPRLGQAQAMGLIDKIDPALAPNFDRVFPTLKNDYWAARSVAPWVLSFDSNLFSKEEVQEQGWSILLDRKIKGRVAIPNFGWMGEMWLHSINQGAGYGYDNLDSAIDLAAKIIKDNNGIVMVSNDQGLSLFTTGEIAAAPFWSGRTIELQGNGIPVDYVFPKGWGPYGFGFSVVSGIERPDLSQKLVDFSLSDECQLAFAREFSYVPTLRDLEIPEDMPDSKVAPEVFEIAANLDYAEVAKFSDANLERWNKEVIG